MNMLLRCARGPPKMIPRRYAKGIELAAVNEINKQLRRMGSRGLLHYFQIQHVPS